MQTIKLPVIYQQSSDDCVISVIATITSIPYDEVKEAAIKLFNTYVLSAKEEFELYLSLGVNGITFLRPDYNDNFVWIPGRTYVATVPSPSGDICLAHRITFQTVLDKELGKNTIKVYDVLRDSIYKEIDISATPVLLVDVWEIPTVSPIEFYYQ